MSLFDINFFAKAIEWAPPYKRFEVNIRWLQSLLKPMQYLRDKVLGDYRTGSNNAQWVAGTYQKGDRVTLKQIVYESIEDDNSDTPPSSKWMTFLPSFIGADKRIKFNGQKLVLEYALNQRFLTVFRQPELLSDIYITTTNFVVVGFVVAQTESYCSEVGQTYSTASVGYNYPFAHVSNFTINIPVAVYAGISEAEVRGFVDKIIPSGLNYSIATY